MEKRRYLVAYALRVDAVASLCKAQLCQKRVKGSTIDGNVGRKEDTQSTERHDLIQERDKK
jgi:hypothetical protein